MVSALQEGLQIFDVARTNSLMFLEKRSSKDLRSALLEEGSSDFHGVVRNIIVRILFGRKSDPERPSNLYAVVLANVDRVSIVLAAEELYRNYGDDLRGCAREKIEGILQSTCTARPGR